MGEFVAIVIVVALCVGLGVGVGIGASSATQRERDDRCGPCEDNAFGMHCAEKFVCVDRNWKAKQ